MPRYTTIEDYQKNADIAIDAYEHLSDARNIAHNWLIGQSVQGLDFEKIDSVADALDRLGFYTISGPDYYALTEALMALEGIAGRSSIRARER